MTTVISTEIERGDWVVDHPTIIRHLCYEVRGVDGEYVRLRALHIVTKARFDCSSHVSEVRLIRKGVVAP